MNLELTMLFIFTAILIVQQLEIYQLKKDRKRFKKVFTELSDQYNNLKDMLDEADNEQTLDLNKNNNV